MGIFNFKTNNLLTEFPNQGRKEGIYLIYLVIYGTIEINLNVMFDGISYKHIDKRDNKDGEENPWLLLQFYIKGEFISFVEVSIEEAEKFLDERMYHDIMSNKGQPIDNKTTFLSYRIVDMPAHQMLAINDLINDKEVNVSKLISSFLTE